MQAPPTSAHAYYDIENRQLILKRPAGSRSWSHILSAFFHQLMPAKSGSEISKLTLSLRPLMLIDMEEAHYELSAAGIPILESEDDLPEDLTSLELGEIGVETEPGGGEDGSASTFLMQVPDERKLESGNHESAQQIESLGKRSGDSDGKDAEAATGASRQYDPASNGVGTEVDSSKDSSKFEPRQKKARPKHKEQWDRRLLSYVRWKQEDALETGEQTDLSAHNLAVEAISRDAVCAYEKKRGRVAEQMAQTHPGYDIVSHDSLTGEDRYIEVKGVNGEWNQTGVGLSRLQFSNAQDYGDQYWLYVVEFVSDLEHIRVHPIQSPATQVTSFMFDGNWREAVTEEHPDPSAQFVPGARLHHQDMGPGLVLNVVSRGSTKLMTIQFDGKESATPNVTLNIHRMHILEELDGDADS